jgi:hypothetical protein
MFIGMTFPFFGGLLGFFGGLVFAPTTYFVSKRYQFEAEGCFIFTMAGDIMKIFSLLSVM